MPLNDPDEPLGFRFDYVNVLEAHSLIRYLIDECGLAIDESAVHRYWDVARKRGVPWAVSHPASRNHIPLGLYADSARVDTEFGQYKVIGIFMNLPLFRPKSTRYSRWLLWSSREDKMYRHHTLNRIYARVTWSMNLLFDGVMPRTGPSGEPLPLSQSQLAGAPICRAGHVFACTELRGDWLYHKQCFRFTASWSGHTICFKCTARRVGHAEDLYTNVDSAAKWLQEEFDTVDCLALRMPTRDPRSSSINMLRMMFCLSFFK